MEAHWLDSHIKVPCDKCESMKIGSSGKKSVSDLGLYEEESLRKGGKSKARFGTTRIPPVK